MSVMSIKQITGRRNESSNINKNAPKTPKCVKRALKLLEKHKCAKYKAIKNVQDLKDYFKLSDPYAKATQQALLVKDFGKNDATIIKAAIEEVLREKPFPPAIIAPNAFTASCKRKAKTRIVVISDLPSNGPAKTLEQLKAEVHKPTKAAPAPHLIQTNQGEIARTEASLIKEARQQAAKSNEKALKIFNNDNQKKQQALVDEAQNNPYTRMVGSHQFTIEIGGIKGKVSHACREIGNRLTKKPKHTQNTSVKPEQTQEVLPAGWRTLSPQEKQQETNEAVKRLETFMKNFNRRNINDTSLELNLEPKKTLKTTKSAFRQANEKNKKSEVLKTPEGIKTQKSNSNVFYAFLEMIINFISSLFSMFSIDQKN